MAGGLNKYGYVGGNPVNNGDPYGLYAIADDAIAAGIGALIGVAGQGIGDLIAGEPSDLEDYAASIIGGAAGGVVFLYTGPIGAGAIGGAVTNATKQGLRNLTNKQCGLSGEGFVFDTALGGLTGIIPGIPKTGINRGRGSWQHVSNRIMTQLDNGSISNVRGRTLAKMFGVKLWNGIGGIGAGVVAVTGAERIGVGGDCTCGVNP